MQFPFFQKVIGARLTHLSLYKFKFVDVIAIGENCPRHTHTHIFYTQQLLNFCWKREKVFIQVEFLFIPEVKTKKSKNERHIDLSIFKSVFRRFENQREVWPNIWPL